MKSGRETIYQAGLSLANFAGFADFLVRVPEPSVFGHYSYEAWDTKLARKPKPYFSVQLCCYSEMLAKLQQRLPKEFCVVLGTKEQRRFRTEDFFYYYRQLKLAFLEQQERFDAGRPPEIPSPNNLGRWSEHASCVIAAHPPTSKPRCYTSPSSRKMGFIYPSPKILEARDDLSLIAGIRSTQVHKLRGAGIDPGYLQSPRCRLDAC
jgi:predicted RecB family nuclease